MLDQALKPWRSSTSRSSNIMNIPSKS